MEILIGALRDQTNRRARTFPSNRAISQHDGDRSHAGATTYTSQMMETSVDLTEGLPHDLLADVLRRLQPSPRSLAVSRCVCKAWRRAVIDTDRLLTDLLPHSLAGIFVHDVHGTLPKYFSPMSPTKIDAFSYLDALDAERLTIRQHCNGLLLLGDEEVRVLNPATRQSATLPPPPPMYTPGLEDVFRADTYMGCHDQYLVFDPTVSPHYEVFLIKNVPDIPCVLMAPHIKEREWPPSTFVFPVLSSTTNQWEERTFIREGETARNIEYMIEAFESRHSYGVYWQGALYIRQYDFVMRITLSSHKYQVIELPESLSENWFACRLGKSENGVYCSVFTDYDGLKLEIWYLDETCDQIKWTFKCDVNLHTLLANFSKEHSGSPSNVQCANSEEDNRSNSTDTEDRLKQSHIKYSLLGFHPNEEIVFFHTPLKRVLAYHFDSSKIEDLGCLPTGSQDGIYVSLPYTPLLDKRLFKRQVA